MRRSLNVTVAAAVSMVLLAMLVPLAVLLRSYVVEDRLSRAALEVQTTETVVSGAGDDKGTVSVYLDRINTDGDIQTTVYYPDGTVIPSGPEEDDRVREARQTGQARLDDAEGGAEFLVPVSLGGGSASPQETPVIKVTVKPPGLEADLVRTYAVLLGLGLLLLGGGILLADRLGRSFVGPIRGLAEYAQRLGDRERPAPIEPDGPPEVRDLAVALNRLVERIEVLLERERAGVADLSHRLRTPMTAMRLRIDAVSDPEERTRLAADLDDLESMVDHLVSEARRSEREGLVPGTDAISVLAERARFWQPLAEDQGRPFTLSASGAPSAPVRASEHDLVAMLDVLLDNVFTHTPEGAAVAVTLEPREEGGVRLTVDDAGPGFPDGLDVRDRGTSGAGSTGLGLSIAEKTATESGGGLSVTRSPQGGGRVVVELS